MIVRAHAVRWLPIGLAAVAAVAGARALAPSATSAPTADRTFLAYRVAAGQPLSFAVSPGDQDLALTVQSERAEPSPPSRFTVHALLEDAAGVALWRGQGEVESDAGAMVVENERPATAPRTLRIDLPEVPEGAHLVVTANGASGEDRPAIFRLVRRRQRASLTGEVDTHRDTRGVGSRASVFGWAYLDEEARDVLLEQPIIRCSAADKRGDHAELVHVKLLPRERPAPIAPQPGETVDGLQGLAYTVRGPGKLRLTLAATDAEPASFQVTTISNKGAVTSARQDMPDEGKELTFDAPADGAMTVVIAAPTSQLRVRAYVSAGASRLGGVPAVAASANKSTEIAPDRRRVVLWRARPAGPPIVATLSGDGTARVQLRPVGGVARVAWRVLDGERTVAEGKMPIALLPALFERLRPEDPMAPPAAASEPIALLASGPPGARLEIVALDAPIDVEVAAPDDIEASELNDAYSVTLDKARLRFAPYARRKFVPFVPDNHAMLAMSAGRVILEGQVRFEPAGHAPLPAGPFVTVVPDAPRTRQLLAEVDDEGARMGFATGSPVEVKVAEDGAGVGRLVLDYLLGAEALGGTLRVLIDGQPAEERMVNVTRGSIRLRDLPPGAHQITVEGAPGTVFTSSRGSGGQLYSERAVYRIDRGGALTIPVRTGNLRAANLNVVLYADTPIGRLPEVTARVDINTPGGAGMRAATPRTRRQREIKVPTQAIKSVWLDREHGAVTRARFAVQLGEDLGGGVHRVRLSLGPGAPDRMFARFFVTGRDNDLPVSYAGTEWAED